MSCGTSALNPLQNLKFPAILVVVLSLPVTTVSAADRPNILWITAEDMSPNLGCYGDPDVTTPRLDAFAGESVRYTHAFATAPVCSPARSCLITGLYATSLGTQRLRSAFPIPDEFVPFTAALRAAGYRCTNNVKTDYNLAGEADFIARAWDENSPRATWRSAGDGQPFFAVHNLMTTHQSRTSVWPEEQFEEEIGARLPGAGRHDPASLTLPPFYPDSPAARQAWARYLDCIAVMDKQVGRLLDTLESDGLADDTIVFFFSDHGMGMPRGKRVLYDSGLRVPLLIRVPEKWRALAPGAPGSVTDRLVSFVDFPPSVLAACGLPVPDHFQGQAFLGTDQPAARAFVFGARDRVDEAFDVARSVRDGRWLYIRNYFPHLPWLQPEGYSDQSPFRRRLAKDAAPRPREELYDCTADPHQMHNLADDPANAGRLRQMRDQLQGWQLRTRDLGFLTEPQVWERLDDAETPWQLGRDPERYPLASLLTAAGDVDGAVARMREAIDSGQRYWAAVTLEPVGPITDQQIDALGGALGDPDASVRIAAASALANHGNPDEALPVLIAALSSESPDTVLLAARAIELSIPDPGSAAAPMRAALDRARQAESAGDPIAMFIRFSLESALAEARDFEPE